jgi:hypothetical protein
MVIKPLHMPEHVKEGTVEEQVCYLFVSHVFYCYGASKTRNTSIVRGEILQTIWVKNAPDIFRIKSVVFPNYCCLDYTILRLYKPVIFLAEI